MNFRPEVTGRATLHSAPAGVDDDRVLTFDEWCGLNGFSRSTGQRIRTSGEGPRFVQLSARRIGVIVSENRRWQKSRLIDTAA
jgi:predicted DNA-binding transcriptional regulator AlpA